ncbi:MAG: hypothetical protein ACLQU3_15945 [Limisphaerales bacterium]
MLLREWDPLGVGDNPNLADEYDKYLGDVAQLLARPNACRMLSHHLGEIEEQMGVNLPDAQRDRAVAALLAHTPAREPDVIIKVRFATPEEGGRQTALRPGIVDYYGCPFVVGGEAFDCRLILTGRTLELGQTYEVPVKFMNWPLVGPRLMEGTPFVLWEGKDVATGSIVRVVAGRSSGQDEPSSGA